MATPKLSFKCNDHPDSSKGERYHVMFTGNSIVKTRAAKIKRDSERQLFTVAISQVEVEKTC